MTAVKAIERAIEVCGGASKLAAELEVSIQRISNWIDRGVPHAYCHRVELATGGRVRVEELRPDVAWLRVPDGRWPAGRPVIDVTAAVGAS